MLASPLYPAPPFSPGPNAEDSAQYHPARDIESFNSLLPPAVEFVEGSSSGTLAVAEGKYEPINASPKAHPATQPNGTLKPLPQMPTKSPHKSKHAESKPRITPLFSGTLETSWPGGVTVGTGLCNVGNTCFLNSALQCLLHTPPLLRMLWDHSRGDQCRVKTNFCMACALRQVMTECHSRKRAAFNPFPIHNKLQTIAKHMKKGRQEDSHEFLRYAIDALQKSCLAGYPPKIDPKLAETTWVHKMFGGRLRSRVTCQECHHNSDTFDSILDLSIEVQDCGVLRDALKRFVAVDYLKGTNKYKCEKCKRPVVATKRLTIHEAPLVLTVHLKRFTPMGRKIGHPLKYEDRLSLQPYMSDGQYGPTYSLYGIICHAGGGPNSGHYYAYVKGSNNKWYEMNDEQVSPLHSPPMNMKNAYVLLYMRAKGQALEAAVSVSSVPMRPNGVNGKMGVAAAMKKRKHNDGEEDVGVKAAPTPPSIPVPFIGPVLPAPPVAAKIEAEAKAKETGPRLDPQAQLVKKKIAAITASPALQSLAQYTDDDDEEDEGEKLEGPERPSAPSATSDSNPRGINGSAETTAPAMPSQPTETPTRVPSPLATPVRVPIPPSSFYGSSNSKKGGDTGSGKKRKSPDHDEDRRSEDRRDWARQPLTFSSPGRKESKWKDRSHGSDRRSSYGSNPFSRLSGGNNLRSPRDDNRNSHSRALQKYGKKRQRLIF